MHIIQQFSVNNPCYQLNLKRRQQQYRTFQDRGPQGLVLHSVGCNQSQAQVFANQWARYTAQVAVHAVLQHDGLVIQCLPWNYLGWHVGGAANLTHIGVEMTEPDYRTPDARAQVKGTYETAVELFAYLCKKYKIDPKNIISHREAHQRGLGSNHGDPELLWKRYNTGYTMDGFRKAVQNKIKGVSTPEQKTQNSTQTQAPKNQNTTQTKPTYKVGDSFKLKTGAKYSSGASIPSWVFSKKLYIRSIRANGDIVFSTNQTGAVTGVIKPENMQF